MNRLTTSTVMPARALKAEALADMLVSFERLCLAAGVETLALMMEADARAACGPHHARGPHRTAHRWGRTKGRIGFHGGKVEIECPWLRGFDGKEQALPSCEATVMEDWLDKWAMNQMLINVSTRKFKRSMRLPEGDVPAPKGSGLSKSAASRRFVALSAARLKDWMAQDLSGLGLLVIQIDGIHLDEDITLVAAIGVDVNGDKHPLGLVEGATENAVTVQALIGNLVKRGLDVDAVAVEIAALYHDIAKVDANAQHDVAILWLAVVGRRHALLQLDGTLHGVDGAGELHQHAIPRGLEYATLVLRNQRIEHIHMSRPKRDHSADFISFHEPAEADHVGGHDGRKMALSAFFGHLVRRLSEGTDEADCIGALFLSPSAPHDRCGSTSANPATSTDGSLRMYSGNDCGFRQLDPQQRTLAEIAGLAGLCHKRKFHSLDDAWRSGGEGALDCYGFRCASKKLNASFADCSVTSAL